MSEQHDPIDPDAERRRRQNECNRRWRAANRDKVSEFNRRYKEAHWEQIRERRREYNERVAKPRGQRRRKRYAAWRRRQAENPELERERARQGRIRYVERQMASDPEGYRVKVRANARAYRAKNREKLNAQKRERYLRDPERMRATTRAYLDRNREAVRLQRSEYYKANREKILAANRRWKQREQHRRENGLPPNRLHKVPGPEKLRNRAAADEFFSRRRSADEIERIKYGGPGPTPEHLIAAWNQATERVRALHRYRTDKTLAERLEQEREARREKEAAEEARMDAIARVINDRLRRHPRTTPAAQTHQPPSPGPIRPQRRGL